MKVQVAHVVSDVLDIRRLKLIRRPQPAGIPATAAKACVVMQEERGYDMCVVIGWLVCY